MRRDVTAGVVAGLGWVLVGAGVLLGILHFHPFGPAWAARMGGGGLYLALTVLQVGVMCLWWLVWARTSEVPPGPVVKWLVRIVTLAVAWMLLGVILSSYAAASTSGQQAFAWSLPVLGMQVLALAYLFRKPRLLLTWSIGVLAMWAVVVMIPIPVDLLPASDVVMSARLELEVVEVHGIPLLVLVLGSLLALPFALRWGVTEGGRKQGVGFVAGLGVLLLVGEGLVALGVAGLLHTDIVGMVWKLAPVGVVAQAGALCAWWWLSGQDKSVLSPWLDALSRVGGVLSLLVVAAMGVLVAGVWWLVGALAVSLVTGVRLFRSRGLLLLWGVGGFSQAVLVVTAVAILWSGEDAAMASWLMMLPVHGFLLGTIVSLPFAWWLIRRRA